MEHNIRLDDIDAFTLREALDRGQAAVIVPVGSLEQHGPHLPLGTDAVLSTYVAERVATRLEAFVAPALSYGYKSQQKSGGGDHLLGTTSLTGGQVSGMARDLTIAYLRQGFAQVIFVNGHYENYQFLYEGVDTALHELGFNESSAADVILLSYWDFVSEETLATVYPDGFPGWDVEHGGVLETSLMLYLQPGSVRIERAMDHPPATFPRFDRLPVVARRTPESGCLSSPAGASTDKGRLLFEQLTADMGTELEAELAGRTD